MALTFVNLQDIVLDHIEISDATTRTRVMQYLNMAGRDIWERYAWQERRKEAWLSTQAPYETGTVVTTQASDTVTGTGTTWTAAHGTDGGKFAKSLSDNFYTFSRDSATQLTLDRTWVETALAASAYIIYFDTLTVASNASQLIDLRVASLNRGSFLAPMTQHELDNLVFMPRTTGVPYRWAPMNEDSSGSMQIRLWPVPDDAYQIRYQYLTDWTDLSGDSDVPVLDETKADLLILGALRWAYLLAYEAQKAELARDRFEKEVKRAWLDDRRRRPNVVQLRKFDDRVRGSSVYHLPTVDGN